MDLKSWSSIPISSNAVTTDPESDTIGAILCLGFLEDNEIHFQWNGSQAELQILVHF